MERIVGVDSPDSSRPLSGPRLAPSASALVFVLAALVAMPALAAQPDHPRVRVELAARPATVLQGSEAIERTLEQSTGASWVVEMDPWSQTATRGVGGKPGSGAAVSEAAAWAVAAGFASDHGVFLGAAGAELERVRWLRTSRAWHATWQQMSAGRPILGCYLDLVLADDGDPVAFRSKLVPDLELPEATPDPEAARRACENLLGDPVEIEAWRPVGVVDTEGGRYAGVPALELELRGRFGARWLAHVEATTHRVLGLESRIRNEIVTGATTGEIKPAYAADPLVTRDFPWVRVALGDPETANTWGDAVGQWRFNTIPGNAVLRARLEGLWAQVDHEASAPPSPGPRLEAAVPGTATLHFGASEAREDERTIYYHTSIIHDFMKEKFDYSLLDFSMPAVAAVRNPANGSPDYANAFWDGQRMAFGNGAGSYQNFGLFADVIYHEYVHAVTDYIYRPAGGLPGAIGAAIHEGRSDYFACTITDEPLVGEYVSGGPFPFRDLDNALRWPQDRDPGDEEHANGEILGGALWDVRMRTGPEVADAIIHFAAYQYPVDFEEYLEAILIADDLVYGDAAPGNGSPHRDAVLAAFAEHGMGPLAGQPVRLHHVALRDTEDEGVARRVEADAGWVLPDAVSRMELTWSTGGSWTTQLMQAEPTGGFSGEIPGQPAGTTVQYWLRASRVRPYAEYRLPETAPDSVFTYAVGPDATPPRIDHVPRTQVPAFSWPAELAIHIDDNLGVAHVYVEHTLNGEPGAILGLTRSDDDPTLYRTRFPGVGGQLGDVVEYWITAVDASQAANTARLPETGTFRLELVENLSEGFEDGAPAWLHLPVVAGRPDPWHLTTAFNRTTGGTHAWWCGVESGEYATGTAATLVTDWYGIGDGAQASIWSWMDAEPNVASLAFDGGIVEIQAEGNLGWELLVPQGGYTHTMSPTAGTNYLEPGTPCLSGRDTDWRQLVFDLGPWAGQHVRLRFLFGSDGSLGFPALRGWLVDDFFLDPGVRDPTDVAVPGPDARRRLLAAPPSPNPFNPSLTFELAVPAGAGRVRLDVFDTRGRLAATLLDATPAPGSMRLVWDGRNVAGSAVPSGVYLYRLTSAAGSESGKVVLMR